MFKNRPGLLFSFLLLMFFIPLLGAWYMFSEHKDWIAGTVNKGTLIRPMWRIESLPMTDYNMDYSFNPQNWRQHWVLLYIKGDGCDQSCFRMIYEINQIRKATGKYQDKILTAYVSAQPDNMVNPSAQILRHLPDTRLLKTSLSDLAPFLKDISLTKTTLEKGQLFIIDPQGYVMMRYPSNVDPEDVFHDMQRVLNLEGE